MSTSLETRMEYFSSLTSIDAFGSWRLHRVGKVRAVLVVGVLAVLVSGCSVYGGETVGEELEGGFVQTDGEHCAVTLPDAWTWLPAKWSARSPLGTEMSFTEQLFGRPVYPDWEEVREATLDDIESRVPDAAIDATDDRITVDYGEDGGMMVLQRFDRVGCQLTFSRVEGARAQEFADWQAIIASLERTSPTPGFTPVAD